MNDVNNDVIPTGPVIGVFGGTFNPPHIGHMTFAVNFTRSLHLDLLLMVPNRVPPHKSIACDVAPEQRLKMLELALEDTRGQFGAETDVQISTIELQRDGASFMCDTIERLRQIYNPSKCYLLLGDDMFMTLESWRDPARLLSMCSIAAVLRSHSEIDTEHIFIQGEYLHKKYSTEIIFPNIYTVEISSTYIRDRIKNNALDDIKPFLTPGVYGYILQNPGLYR